MEVERPLEHLHIVNKKIKAFLTATKIPIVQSKASHFGVLITPILIYVYLIQSVKMYSVNACVHAST
jgi:hypothetical protein